MFILTFNVEGRAAFLKLQITFSATRSESNVGLLNYSKATLLSKVERSRNVLHLRAYKDMDCAVGFWLRTELKFARLE